jgi:hypothetical protein
MPADKVKVVPEGVDVNTFYPEDPKTNLIMLMVDLNL